MSSRSTRSRRSSKAKFSSKKRARHSEPKQRQLPKPNNKTTFSHPSHKACKLDADTVGCTLTGDKARYTPLCSAWVVRVWGGHTRHAAHTSTILEAWRECDDHCCACATVLVRRDTVQRRPPTASLLGHGSTSSKC